MANPKTKLIQHLGIVAGVCNEVKLADNIDLCIPGGNRKVSVGQAVQAMILNALGFAGRALYLTKRFFISRPIENLIGPDITANQLHDTSLGKALDAIYEYGITELFFQVASKILLEFGIKTQFAHLDSTTFSLHGEYNSEAEDIPEGTIWITKGHSKDNAPELNQAVVQLICSNRTTIPLWLEALSGNTSDKKSFRETVKRFQKQFKADEMPYMVMDSAFYSKKNLIECADVKWVTRVPEIINEVKALNISHNKEDMIKVDDNYSYLPVESLYADIQQRWLIIFSEKAYNREIKTFERNLDKRRDRNRINLKHLANQSFACKADAINAAEKFSKKIRYQNLSFEVIPKKYYKEKGRPNKISIPEKVEWHVNGKLFDDEKSIIAAKKNKGKFIVATNEMNTEILSDIDLLSAYKDQGVSVERGFRFLKDPYFYAESLYLKKPERIMALIMIMTLSLLIYSLAELKVRESMKEKKISIWDQKNRLTQTPTIRWICMIFEDVLILYHSSGSAQAMNIREEHIRVLKSLGPDYQKMYFL